MKTNRQAAPLRHRSFDRLFLTILLIASGATLIVACTREPGPDRTNTATRSMPPGHPMATNHETGPDQALLSYSIDRSWPRVPDEMAGGIDAAINWENGDYSWFRGPHLATLRQRAPVQAGTDLQRVASAGTGANAFWPGLSVPESHAIDAALYWDAQTAYFFQGDRFSRFDRQRGTFSPFRPISSTSSSNPWRSLPPAFRGGIDAAVNDGLGNILLFRGKDFLRYDRYLNQVLEGPAPIASRWPMLPQEFHQGVDAAMRRGRGKVTLFRDGLNVEIITSEAL